MNILIVEDNPVTLRLLEKKLKELDYTIHLAENGNLAWDMLNSFQIDIVVSDWIMPEMNGLELCLNIRNANFENFIYFIIVSAQDSQTEIVHGLEAGVDDYITKPINFDELRARIKIGARIVRQEKELANKYDEIKKNYFQTIHMFTNLIEVFNKELGGHCRRVASLSLELAKRLPDVSEEDFPVLEATGLLHDIGMIGLPTEILSKKKTEMDSDHRELYLSHPVRGEIILKEIEFLLPVAKLVRAHHEQFNGCGFPDGLNGREIPLLAKIVSAASTYDNLIHKGKISLDQIPEYLQRMRGYQLEPLIVDHLLEINLKRIQEEAKKDHIEVMLDDLKEGMMLATHIKMKSGALVMPSRTVLNNNSIEKLKNYNKLAFIPDKININKDSIRG